MAETAYIPRLRTEYDETIKPNLIKEFGYKNVMQAPKLDKIVLNMGVGEAVADTKKVRAAAADMERIAGQKPVITHARKSIAGFKVREEMPLGVKVTLRKARMYEFLDRLVNIALPRVRDFRGLNPNSFDGHGNYAMGIKEHIIFPVVWISSCAPPRGPTTRRAHCSRLSISPSGSNGRVKDRTWQRPAPSKRTTSASASPSSTLRSAPSSRPW